MAVTQNLKCIALEKSLKFVSWKLLQTEMLTFRREGFILRPHVLDFFASLICLLECNALLTCFKSTECLQSIFSKIAGKIRYEIILPANQQTVTVPVFTQNAKKI